MKELKALSSPSSLREEDGLRLPPPAQVPIPEASQNPVPLSPGSLPRKGRSPRSQERQPPAFRPHSTTTCLLL